MLHLIKMSKYKLARLEYVDNRVIEIDCNLEVTKTFTDKRLINAKKIECAARHTTGNWYVIVSSFSGYSLNTYGSNSVGIIFDKLTGKVTFQHSSPQQFIIEKIIVTY